MMAAKSLPSILSDYCVSFLSFGAKDKDVWDVCKDLIVFIRVRGLWRLYMFRDCTPNGVDSWAVELYFDQQRIGLDEALIATSLWSGANVRCLYKSVSPTESSSRPSHPVVGKAPSDMEPSRKRQKVSSACERCRQRKLGVRVWNCSRIRVCLL